ncbi:MAG: 2-C-methyl-D-erythritol 4-phosphate cytidylyltransferase [Actinomycetota bacterium]|nr:2-C-methyl-D-erythritol 4-phosphate cytidylyltransferase [Actinomycetota bacterium]
MAHASAVIAAAGSGERLGAGGPKAFVEAFGRPLLAWSLTAFDAAASIERIVVAAPPRAGDRVAALAEEAGVEVEIVSGGDYRSQSVANAMQRVGTDLVVVHDAARPLVSAKLIDEIVRRLDHNTDVTGVIAAAPVTDTIKEASVSRRVLRTPERSRMWAVQTPQAFRTAAMRDAIAAHPDQLGTVTDDAMLVERSGGEVLIHEAPVENMKVTTPHDLQVAAMLLAERKLED